MMTDDRDGQMNSSPGQGQVNSSKIQEREEGNHHTHGRPCHGPNHQGIGLHAGFIVDATAFAMEPLPSSLTVSSDSSDSDIFYSCASHFSSVNDTTTEETKSTHTIIDSSSYTIVAKLGDTDQPVDVLFRIKGRLFSIYVPSSSSSALNEVHATAATDHRQLVASVGLSKKYNIKEYQCKFESGHVRVTFNKKPSKRLLRTMGIRSRLVFTMPRRIHQIFSFRASRRW